MREKQNKFLLSTVKHDLSTDVNNLVFIPIIFKLLHH